MRLLILWFVFACAFIIVSQSEGSLDLDMLKSKFLPSDLFGMNFTAEDGKKMLREKCRKVTGGNETIFLQAHRGSLEFIRCISGLGNITAIQEEIEIAKPFGDLDTVFHKYCNKRSKAELCFDNFMTSLNPCLSIEERLRHSTFVGVASNILGFVCQKGGDQIALFYAEQGPECLEENTENINACMNTSFSDYIPTKNQQFDPNNLPKLAFGKKECKDIQDFEKCVLFHLEKCNDITPSNIIESLFKYVKNETQCEPKPKLAAFSARSGGTKSTIQMLLIINLFVVLMFSSKCWFI